MYPHNEPKYYNEISKEKMKVNKRKSKLRLIPQYSSWKRDSILDAL